MLTKLATSPLSTGGIGYDTETKWNEWGKWYLDSTITEGGKYPAFWLTAQCICARNRSGMKKTSIKLKWIRLFMCVESSNCESFFKKTTHTDLVRERVKTIGEVERKIVAAGIYMNETSAWIACNRKCQSLGNY